MKILILFLILLSNLAYTQEVKNIKVGDKEIKVYEYVLNISDVTVDVSKESEKKAYSHTRVTTYFFKLKVGNTVIHNETVTQDGDSKNDSRINRWFMLKKLIEISKSSQNEKEFKIYLDYYTGRNIFNKFRFEEIFIPLNDDEKRELPQKHIVDDEGKSHGDFENEVSEEEQGQSQKE